MPHDRFGDVVNLKDYPYLTCRFSFLHSFKVTGFYKHRENGQRFTVAVRDCPECATERYDFIDGSGTRVRRIYVRPDGYEFVYDEGEDKLTYADYAKAITKRETVYDNLSDLLDATRAKKRLRATQRPQVRATTSL